VVQFLMRVVIERQKFITTCCVFSIAKKKPQGSFSSLVRSEVPRLNIGAQL